MNTEKDFEIAKKIAHVLSGDCSEENKSSLDEWLSESEDNRNFYEHILDGRNCEKYQKKAAEFDKTVGWEKLSQKCHQKSAGRPIRMRRRFLRWVAVISLVCGMGVAARLYWEQKMETEKQVTQNEVVQGSTRAMLTLADGKVVDLEKTKGGIIEKQSATNIYNQGDNLIYEDSLVQTVEEVVFNKVTVPRGGEFKLTLSDGTVVHLNAETVLSYPVHFVGNTREVELHGEAYFEVAKDAAKPFIVKTSRYNIEVLGTHFNVADYESDALVHTTLVEGKVAVSGPGIRQRVLQPNEQFVLDKNTGKQDVKTVDVSYLVAWKDARFRFRDVRLEDIMHAIERWYDVTVFYENQEVKDYRFGFNVGRDESIDPLLRIFEANGKVKIDRNGKVLRIRRGR